MSKTLDIRAGALRKALKAQGRTVTWLARQTGYTRSYTSGILNGQYALTNDFVAKAASALDIEPFVTDIHHGLPVRVPQSVFTRSAEAIAETFEDAWQAAWVREHGPAVLAREAELAYRAAKEGGR